MGLDWLNTCFRQSLTACVSGPPCLPHAADVLEARLASLGLLAGRQYLCESLSPLCQSADSLQPSTELSLAYNAPPRPLTNRN